MITLPKLHSYFIPFAQTRLHLPPFSIKAFKCSANLFLSAVFYELTSVCHFPRPYSCLLFSTNLFLSVIFYEHVSVCYFLRTSSCLPFSTNLLLSAVFYELALDCLFSAQLLSHFSRLSAFCCCSSKLLLSAPFCTE